MNPPARARERRGQKSRGSGAALAQQLGLFDMPDLDSFGTGLDDDGSEDDDDIDLEAELSLILGTGGGAPAPRPTAKSRETAGGVGVNLDSLVEGILKDAPSDDEAEDDDDEDPSLLEELDKLTGGGAKPGLSDRGAEKTDVDTQTLSLLTERLDLYRKAHGAAKLNNDRTKARRLERGVDRLESLLKQAKRGEPISADDIPVPVVIAKPSAPRQPSPTQDSATVTPSPEPRVTPEPTAPSQSSEEVLTLLAERINQYKRAALAAKKRDDIPTAVSYVQIVKKFEVMVEAVKGGKPVDLTTIPPPPPTPVVTTTQPPPEAQPPPSAVPAAVPQSHSVNAGGGEMTIESALESRLEKYREQEERAEREGNQGKQRRMSRIVKQYEEALSLHRRGKPIPVDELPTPPGFPPIPVEKPPPPPPPSPRPTHQVSPTVQHPPTVTPPPSKPPPPSPSHSPSSSSPTSTSRGGSQSRSEKQLLVLMERQKEYKGAAVKALKDGDTVKAKHLLRLSKCFDPVIEATKCGLPVDMDTVPASLSKKSAESEPFEIVSISECLEGPESEISNKLLSDLDHQFKMCVDTLNHFKAIGDVANANRFEKLASDTKKDYNSVRGARASNSPLPKFHYEWRTFSIIRCNVDLSDNDLELNIIKGINYNVPNPKEIDTYIRYEFAYPNDEVKSEKTSTVYNTNNPEYNTVFRLTIQRNLRSHQRLFKRHAIKLHLYSKGGFLRSDQLLGTAQVKLNPLETACTVHDTYQILDGRKPIGGTLEVKVRLRNPISGKQMEQIKEKWLIID